MRSDALIHEVPGLLQPVDDPSWCIEVEGFDPSREGDVESWLTVGNGRVGLRGSLEEERPESSPALFVAGIFGRAGKELWTLEPLPGPELTRLVFSIDGETLDLAQGEIVEGRRILDMQRGILFRTWRQRVGPDDEQLTFSSARFASLADRAFVVMTAAARIGDRPVSLATAIPVPPPVGPVEAQETSGFADRATGVIRGRDGGAIRFAVSSDEKTGELQRIAAIVPVDRAGGPEGTEVDLERAESVGVEALRERHEAEWRQRWSDSDVVVEGDPVAQRGLRFALYHLISAGNPETDRVSIGARGLTGLGYKGHVFWDTDVFMVPFFIYTHPETARALLAYRYRTLPAARERAKSLGYGGALFAWESADTGEDCTPPEIPGPDGTMIPVFTGEQEVHIAADVAWAVWEYWCATNDEDFLLEMGAEIVLETARFWASRARQGSEGRFHIDKVVGPDEYHEDVNDNAFTNVMARWNLERGLDLAGLLRNRYPSEWTRLTQLVDIDEDELEHWESVASGLVAHFDAETDLYEEFAGFFGLEHLPVADAAPRPFSGEEVFGWQRLRATQVVKQADVVMMLHMLRQNFSQDIAAANYRYYEPRTTHGSSLSPAIHSAVAARAGLLDDAVSYFRMASNTDLDSKAEFSTKGVHMATAGGLWQAAVMGFGGLVHDDDHLALDPRLPAAWSRLRFPIRSRGAKVLVDVEPQRVTLTLDDPATVALGRGGAAPLAAGQYAATRNDEGWSALERVGE
jgi:trehalose/maltose hydrolase-like predicted phosphorylase